MHQKLEYQTLKIRDLEKVVGCLQYLSTDSIEHEIRRLEIRKKELYLEVETVDLAISERKERLLEMRAQVKTLLDSGHVIPDMTPSAHESLEYLQSQYNYNENNLNKNDMNSNDDNSLIIESEYQNTKSYDDDPNPRSGLISILVCYRNTF